MSVIYLVRHGQAGFGQDDYDSLSELGRRQGEELGGFWARSGVRLDALYVGPRRRHEQTAEAMRVGARAAGGELPEGRPLPGLDEFPFQAILTAAGARMAAEAAALRAEIGGGDPLRDRRSFDRLFQRAMTHWITGELAEAALPETFAGFLARAQAGLLTVMAEQGRGRTAAVVTSAGPMAAALQLGLGLADPAVLKLCTVLANTALVELRYRGDEAGASPELSVISFNCTPHLGQALVSYR